MVSRFPQKLGIDRGKGWVGRCGGRMGWTMWWKGIDARFRCNWQTTTVRPHVREPQTGDFEVDGG